MPIKGVKARVLSPHIEKRTLSPAPTTVTRNDSKHVNVLSESLNEAGQLFGEEVFVLFEIYSRTTLAYQFVVVMTRIEYG
jgi:hypothetical protein